MLPRCEVWLAGLILCAGASPAAAQALADPIPGPIPQGAVRIRLEPLAGGLGQPLWGTAAPGAPDTLYVAEQGGRVHAIDVATGSKQVFLDVSGSIAAGGESGLLGLAFHPAYPALPFFYTYTSELPSALPDFPAGALNHHSVLREWVVVPAVPPQNTRVLMRIEQPQGNHNGGALAFGPDSMLYVSLGDGGFFNDTGAGHGTTGNGQDPDTVLGSILRIDVDGSDGVTGEYGIPPDNPFVGAPGLDEIWAYGLRNPFRISFDQETGLMWIADVGQADIEEVNVGIRGANYGWRLKEGSFFFLFPLSAVSDQDPGLPPELMLVDPIAEYDHDEGFAVIGGFVYRGARVPALTGSLVLGDLSGRLFYLDGNELVEFPISGLPIVANLHGFGQDARGDVYALTSVGEALRLAPADEDGDGRDHLLDGCPFFFDAPLDSGGVGSGTPDGIGDACQCGDVSGDGAVSASDVDALRAFLAGAGALGAPELCSVRGELECDVADAAVLRRALAGLDPGVGQVCGPATSLFDTDADGVPNATDTCPFAANPDQADVGGAGSTLPDGQGDACQCGDLSADGAVMEVDALLLRLQLLGALPALPGQDLCDTGGGSACDVADAARIARAAAGLPPAILPACAGYGP